MAIEPFETLTLPVAPDPTTADIAVEPTTVKEEAFTPPKVTDEILTKFVPVIVTVCPVVASAGVKSVIVGAAR